ncbi:hypothetical protein A2U01_0118455, partial [Trifolium medium]|nr:hypothetical protein [Trifolium medium]
MLSSLSLASARNLRKVQCLLAFSGSSEKLSGSFTNLSLFLAPARNLRKSV